MIAVLIGAVLAECWLYASRIIYGRLRRNGIDRIADRRTDSYDLWPGGQLKRRNPVAVWDSEHRRGAVWRSLFLGLIWPITLAVATVLCVITARPPKSRHELEAEKAEMARRLAELERELGIKGDGS